MKFALSVFVGLMLAATCALAQGALITVSADGNVTPNTPETFTFHYYNGTGQNIQGMTNGFIFSGQTGTLSVEPVSSTDICSYFDLVCQIKVEQSDPQLVSASFSIMEWSGIPDGFDEDVFTVTTEALVEGDTICIDSSFYPPHNEWLWAPNDIVPAWGGPYCWPVEYDSPLVPNMINCPPTDFYTGSHCTTFIYQFEMFDPYSEGGGGGGGPWFSYFQIASGPGQINSTTGLYTYTPSLADVGAPVTVMIQACDNFPRCGPDVCIITMTFTNEAPVFVEGPGHYNVGAGFTLNVSFAGDAVDCDPNPSFGILNVEPSPVGSYDLEGNVLTFSPEEDDGGAIFDFEVEITDGHDSSTDHVTVGVMTTCCSLRGDINNNGEGPDIADLVFMVNYMFNGGSVPWCYHNSFIDGEVAPPDIADLVYLVNYMFNGGPPPVPCP